MQGENFRLFLRGPIQPKAGTITAPSLWRWEYCMLSSNTHRWQVFFLERAGHSLTLNSSCHSPLPAVEQPSIPGFLVSKSGCRTTPLHPSDVRRPLQRAAPPWHPWNWSVQSKTKCYLPLCALWETPPTPAHLHPAGHCFASPEPTCQEGTLVIFIL